MSGLDEVEEGVRAAIAAHMPSAQRARAAALEGAAVIGPREGLGFDSVRLVELCLDCEERFGVRIPPELVERGPLTIAALVAEVRRARGGRP